MSGRLKRELKQKRPFQSLEEEVVLAMVRTADQLSAGTGEILKASGLSNSQYNILRILRGTEEGLACGEISERMVRRDPDLTRLLDRLEARGLVARERSSSDRRVVMTTITHDGLRLLEKLDEPMRKAVKSSLAHLPQSRLQMLRDLLEEARGGEE